MYCYFTGDTALHIAVERGCTEIVKLLLQHDADICAVTPHNLTPVFIASQYGHADCLRLLLDEATRQGEFTLRRSSYLGLWKYHAICSTCQKNRICHWTLMQSEKSQPESKQIMQ